MPPPSLSGTFDKYSKRTKQEIFLAKIDGLIPWQALCAVIESHYPKAGNGRPPRGLTEAQQQTNRRKGSVRSRVEHPFLWIKRIRGFTIAGYRGLAKNASRAFVLLALFNIVQWNRQLTP